MNGSKSRGNYGTGGWKKRQDVERCKNCGKAMSIVYRDGEKIMVCTYCGVVPR